MPCGPQLVPVAARMKIPIIRVPRPHEPGSKVDKEDEPTNQESKFDIN